MYEAWFELRRRPFIAAPTPDRYFPAASIEAARATLARCIERSEGPAMLAGGSGIGKSLLLELLASQFKARLEPVQFSGGHLTNRRALLQVILFELGLPYRNLEEGELRLALIEHLSRTDRGTAGLLLLVDEAHSLPIRLLEEVRMITNIVRKGEAKVHLILVGNPALEERLTHPKLDSLSQRLAARCYLEPLSRQETCDYVVHQISSAGGHSDKIFAAGACEAIYRATAGIPRLINQVADHAMMLAYTSGQRQVDAQQIERAWSDMQQLPAPWVTDRAATPPKRAPATSVVEFGQLEEESDADSVASAPIAVATVEQVLAPWNEPAVAARAEATLGGVDEQLSEFAQSIASTAEDQARGICNSEQVDSNLEESSASEEVLVDRYGPMSSARSFAGAMQTTAPLLAEEGLLSGAARSTTLASSTFATDGADEVIQDRYAQIDAQKERPTIVAEPASSQTFFGPTVESLDSLAETCEPRPATDASELLTLAEALLLSEGPPTDSWVGEPKIGLEQERDDRHDPASAPSPPVPVAPSIVPSAHTLPELVVVDDASRQTPLPAPAPDAEVRRQEYRQLFSRLRRGQ